MFRFSIRDLLWLMLVVAVAAAVWRVERRSRGPEIIQLRAENARLAAENEDLTIDNIHIGSLIDPQAGSISRSEKEKLFEKYLKESRVRERLNK